MSKLLPGHSAILHACTIEDEAFVGMGATLLDGVVVEKHSMVGAGSLVKQNTKIPSGEVIFLMSHYANFPFATENTHSINIILLYKKFILL
jgi:carbonic anhydrase/acetyltransferase-like protein (isoleucine patch superfamily)